MLQLPELAWLTFDHQLETLIVVDPSLGPRMEPTLWPSAICSIASGEFRARRGFVHVVATISFRISACSIDTPPLMPERIWLLVACFVLVTKFGDEFFRIYIVSIDSETCFILKMSSDSIESLIDLEFYWEFYSLLLQFKILYVYKMLKIIILQFSCKSLEGILIS